MKYELMRNSEIELVTPCSRSVRASLCVCLCFAEIQTQFGNSSPLSPLLSSLSVGPHRSPSIPHLHPFHSFFERLANTTTKPDIEQYNC